MNIQMELAFFKHACAVEDTRVYLEQDSFDGAYYWCHRHNGAVNARLTMLWNGWLLRRDLEEQIQQAMEQGDLT